MKKKKWAALIAILCLCLLTGAAGAEGEAGRLIAAYQHNDTLYAYTQLAEGVNTDTLSTVIQKDGDEKNEEVSAKFQKNGDIENNAVIYYLLIDNSKSMANNNCQKTVTDFITALSSEESMSCEFNLVTFGTKVHTEQIYSTKSDLDASARNATIQNAVEAISFDEDWTDVYTGIVSTYEYLESNFPAENGQLINLVLITDGEPDFKDGRTDEVIQKEQEAENKIKSSQEICFHRVLCAPWRSESYYQPEGSGKNLLITENNTAAMAKELVSFSDNLYRIDFTGRTTLESREFVFAVSDENQNETTFTAANIFVKPGSQLPEGMTTTQKILIAAIIIILVIIAIVLFFLFGKKKYKVRQQVRTPASIPMRLKVLNGHCVNKRDRFYLNDELIIGSADGCDILFTNPDVSAKNTRVFIQEGRIKIEDLDSDTGTCLEGMRIYYVNPLKSGDLISIGNVKFVLYYGPGVE